MQAKYAEEESFKLPPWTVSILFLQILIKLF